MFGMTCADSDTISDFTVTYQVDMRGNLLGMLSSHPLSLMLSLHHMDAVEPIFPDMNRTQALERLFLAVSLDSARILQQTVCYDSSQSMTLSVAWGYSIQVFEGNELLPDLLSPQKTFMPWKRGMKVGSHYMFNTRDYPKDKCNRPSIFFLDNVIYVNSEIQSIYTRDSMENCPKPIAMKNLAQIRVFSKKLDFDIEEVLQNWFNL